MTKPPRTTLVTGHNLMPWLIEPGDGLKQRCILVARMSGAQMETVSLHVVTLIEEEHT